MALEEHIDNKEVSADAESVVGGNTAFSLDLYGRLKETEGNLFFSPYSISTALAMTYAGARGDTEAQMAYALHFTLGQERLHAAFADLEARVKAVREGGSIQVRVADALWPQIGYPFLEDYLKLVKKYYGVLITAIDYADAEGARMQINKWVEEKTEDKIRDLIKPGILDALTRLVLVNAIYFKGKWASQFDEALTEELPFWVTPAEGVEVPMMSQKQKSRYAETADLQILELPYVGDKVSMLVLLPREADRLAELEDSLTVENLKMATEGMWNREVQVILPRFRMSSQFRLDHALKNLGMVYAFHPEKANFSGMDGEENWLYIAAVLHKAFIDVNEEGTEAAAATAVVMKARGMPPPPPTFHADHPFIFLIRENLTGSILFLGRVMDPTSGAA